MVTGGSGSDTDHAPSKEPGMHAAHSHNSGHINDRPSDGAQKASEFFRSTSRSIVLSSVRSSTNCFNRLCSSWSCFICRVCSVSTLTCCFFHRQKICSLIPAVRITSATGTPSSTRFSTAMICSTENPSSSCKVSLQILPKTNIQLGLKMPKPISRVGIRGDVDSCSNVSYPQCVYRDNDIAHDDDCIS
jgi:hypothetical protein